MRKRVPRDETGNTYGALTVKEKCIKKDAKEGAKKSTKTYWKCSCSCGNTVEVEGGNLRNGNTKSCGRCKTFPVEEDVCKDYLEGKDVSAIAKRYSLDRRQIYNVLRRKGIKASRHLTVDERLMLKRYHANGVGIDALILLYGRTRDGIYKALASKS